jgi:hypothetical protein
LFLTFLYVFLKSVITTYNASTVCILPCTQRWDSYLCVFVCTLFRIGKGFLLPLSNCYQKNASSSSSTGTTARCELWPVEKSASPNTIFPLIKFVSVRLSVHFIIGCWGYTLIDRTELVSGEICVTVLHSS